MVKSEGQRKLLEQLQRLRFAPVARATGLSEPAVRQHASGVRLPKHKARKAYELVGILFSDWDRPPTKAANAPSSAAPEPAAQIADIRAQVAAGGGRDVLHAALRRSTELFEGSVAWVPRDRIATLTASLAAIRALIPLEPPQAPTRCPTWAALKTKLLTVARSFPGELAEITQIVEAFETGCSPAPDALDLRTALDNVLAAGAVLSKGDLADRERVSLESMHVAAGKLINRLDDTATSSADPRWMQFKDRVFPIVHAHPKAWAALVALEPE
jgi:hypothetical protein